MNIIDQFDDSDQAPLFFYQKYHLEKNTLGACLYGPDVETAYSQSSVFNKIAFHHKKIFG